MFHLAVQRIVRAPLTFVVCLAASCHTCPTAPAGASVKITAPARAGSGGADETDDISGTAAGVTPKDARVVIYTHAGDRWWVQPLRDAPFTSLNPNLEWTARIHLGYEYAALLVAPGYSPPPETMQLPQIGGCIWAEDIAKARAPG